MSQPPLLFVIIIAVIVVLGFRRFLQQRKQRAEDDAAPLQSVVSKVTMKREVPVNVRRSRQREVTPVETSVRYEVGFRPAGGGLEIFFRLSAAQYHALSVGDQGTLRYKGRRFVAFQPAADQP
mgnify:FL=1